MPSTFSLDVNRLLAKAAAITGIYVAGQEAYMSATIDRDRLKPKVALVLGLEEFEGGLSCAGIRRIVRKDGPELITASNR